jgi:hypothetical protein
LQDFGAGLPMPDEDDVFTDLLRKSPRYSASKDYVRFDEIEDVLASSDLMALVAALMKKKTLALEVDDRCDAQRPAGRDRMANVARPGNVPHETSLYPFRIGSLIVEMPD